MKGMHPDTRTKVPNEHRIFR